MAVLLISITKKITKLKNYFLGLETSICINKTIKKHLFPIKLNASSLIETLVASVIIIVIFAIASLSINNIFSNTVKSNTDGVQNQMNTIEYLFLNNQLTIPYRENYKNWKIQLTKTTQNNNTYFLLEAKQINTSAQNEKPTKYISKIVRYEVSN